MRLWTVAGVLCVCVLGISAVGCGKKREEAREEAFEKRKIDAGDEAPERAAEQRPAGGEPQKGEKPAPKAALPRKIIYTAAIRLTVEDLGKAERELEKLIDANQGYVIQSQVHGAPGMRRSGEWKARIPAEQFKAFQSAVGKLGELQSSNVDSQDVTSEYYDLKARIKNREAREAALRKMYEDWMTKAQKPADILPIDQELNALRLEIEREQGRLQVLSKLTEMATVTVYFTERKGFVPPEAPGFGTRADRTFSGSLGALEDFGQGLALFGIALVPWLPVLAVVIVPSWVLIRRATRRTPSSPKPPERAPLVVKVAEPTKPQPQAGGNELTS
jgi:hypothetical protein